MGSNSRLVVKIILDIFILFGVAFPILAFQLWVAPYRRGYFRDDTSLMLPYKSSTITELMLATVGFSLNILTIIVLEFMSRSKSDRSVCCIHVPLWTWESYKVVGVFLFGAACQQLTTTVAKYTTGVLRPHFFDLCRPVEVGEVIGSYVENYTCSAPEQDEGLIRDMVLSFPSAHSAFAAYVFLFFALYIHVRLTWTGSKLLKPALQFSAVLAAWYTGLSRITDHKHHWSDVIVGFIVGAAYAVLVFAFVLGMCKRRRRVSWLDEEQPSISSQEPQLPRAALAVHLR